MLCCSCTLLASYVPAVASKAAVLRKNVVPLRGLAGAMMAGFAVAGVVTAAGTGQAELTEIIADCEKVAQNR